MTLMKFVKILSPLILFIIIGITGVYSQDYIQTNNTIYYWFVIPAFVLGIYYAFALTSDHPKTKGGTVALTRIAITILTFAFSYRAMNGFVIYSNCYIGKQTERVITGKVSQIGIPKRKGTFDKNSIVLLPDNSDSDISLEIPDGNYSVGQVFTKKMILGSLGILYSPK
jgi:hypothetical protein